MIKHRPTEPACQEIFSIDKTIYFLYDVPMKIKRKYTMVELAELCGVHPDTLYKSKRRGYCTWQVAGLLESVTGIKRIDWIIDYPTRSSWERVLK